MAAQTAQVSDSQVKSLVDILASQGSLNTTQAEKIKLENINTGKAVEEIINENKLVSEEALTQAKAEFYNVPYVNLRETPSSPEALALLPKSVSEANKLIPFVYDKAKNELSVAFENPLDLEVIEFVERKSEAKIKPFMASASQIKDAVSERYGVGLTTEVTAALKEAVPEVQPIRTKAIDIKKLGEVIREAPIAKIVSTLLEFAVKSRASDIHIEPEEGKTRVRYRIDGILHEKLILPKTVHEALISRIKILSGMKIDEKRMPQDGRFSFKCDGQEVDLRVSCLPGVYGEKIVMRLLKKTGGVPDLPELGLRGRALKNVEEAISKTVGIILVCGPTGSGKTTTLYSVLQRINSTRVNIMTLEDPVEYQIAGVNQVQVNSQAGLTFATGLRAFVRQDPDIIMVGEIRDKETTDLAIQAALTGHLVFSTLHTNSAAGALPRLLDLGAEPFLLASSISTIIGQRVSRRVCPYCKEEYEPPEAVIANLKEVLGNLFDEKKYGKKIKLTRGKGCKECNNSGYLGRIGIFEVMPATEKIGRLILERAPASDLEKEAMVEGMITMEQDGYLKVLEGITSIEEVLRVAEA
jgi:type IV pilus assembly protein PilB